MLLFKHVREPQEDERLSERQLELGLLDIQKVRL